MGDTKFSLAPAAVNDLKIELCDPNWIKKTTKVTGLATYVLYLTIKPLFNSQ